MDDELQNHMNTNEVDKALVCSPKSTSIKPVTETLTSTIHIFISICIR